MPSLTESETKAMLKELMSRLPFRKHGLYCFCNGCTDERISLGIQADKDLIAKLEKENERLKKDAERYRWLRDKSANAYVGIYKDSLRCKEWVNGDEADALVDFGMQTSCNDS